MFKNNFFKELMRLWQQDCARVWDNCSKTLQNKLQKLQNKAGRLITGDLLRNTLWCCQNQTRLRHLTGKKKKTNGYTLMIQIMKGNSINYLRELFTISSNQIYQLRSNNHVLYLPKPNTNALKRSFSYKGAAAWNDIQLDRKLWIV